MMMLELMDGADQSAWAGEELLRSYQSEKLQDYYMHITSVILKDQPIYMPSFMKRFPFCVVLVQGLKIIPARRLT